MISQEEPPQIT